MTTVRQRVLLYGNCQGEWFTQMLQQNAAIAERFDITYLANFGERPAAHPVHDPDYLRSCAVVIWQTAPGCKPPDFLAGVGPDCRQIRFPTLWLKLLWPLHTTDPRNVVERGFPFGRYPYGDRLVLKLLDQGVSLADLPSRYRETDLNTIVNLDRFAEMSLAELRLNDRLSDFCIAPDIEGSFRDQKLFNTLNHPAYPMLSRVLFPLEGALLQQPVTERPPPPHASEILGDVEIPVHPQIVSHFGLRWVPPNKRWRYNSELFSLEEYVRAYAAFTAIPRTNPPTLTLARAQEAAAHGDLAEAQQLLLGAAANNPQLPQFLQCLGRILTRAGQLLEAEKVFRYALAQHPKAVSLHTDLGVLMLQQHFVGEAVRLFKEALRLDPHCAEARRHLIVATGLAHSPSANLAVFGEPPAPTAPPSNRQQTRGRAVA